MDYYSSQISKLIEELSKLPGIGRQMIHSVADILLNLPDDTNVYPGHMGYTTIADEKQYNPLAGYRGREA